MKKILVGSIMATLLVLSACNSSIDEEQGNAAMEDETQEESTSEREEQKNTGILIEGTNYDETDIAYFTLIEELKIEMGRDEEEQQFSSGEMAERNRFWDDQLQFFENQNVQIQNLVEIVSMGLLAEEKNYFIPEEKLQNELEKWNERVAGVEKAEQLIQNRDEGTYKRKLQEYIRLSLLRDRVVEDLEEELQEENPKWEANEMNYALGQMYDDLYMDQINSIQIEINLE
jgi:hypothetical protein